MFFKHCTQIRTFAIGMHPNSTFYDMIIVGGGLVGSAMACSIGTDPVLSSAAMKVLLLESSGRRPLLVNSHQSNESANHTYSNRVSAVSPSSVEMFKTFGVWDEICARRRVHPVSALYVEDACAPSKIHFKQLTKGAPIAHIVENQRIVDALQQCARQRCADVVECWEGTVVDANLSVPENVGKNVTIKLDNEWTVETPLLIAADGHKSVARKRAGIAYDETAYGQQAIVGTLAVEHRLEFDQFFAWQRFMPTGPVALLPLEPRLCSLVWTVPSAEAVRLLQLSPDHFVDELNSALSNNIGSGASSSPSAAHSLLNKSLDCLANALDFLPSKETSAKRAFPRVVALANPHHDDRTAFPLALGYARDYARPRVALIGDAAHRVHPLAGQGVNLGWSDVRFLTAALRRALDEGGDFGSITYLRDFDTECQRHNVPILCAIDCLNRLYSTDHELYVILRSVGLNILDRFLPAKDLIVHLAS